MSATRKAKTKLKAKRMPSAERREQILAVATALFARQGFEGTTTRQIATRVGVKETILFRHFPSKHDLYWAVIEAKCAAGPAQAGLQELLGSARSDREIFTTLAAGLLERNTGDATLMRLLLFSALESHELSQRFRQTYMVQYYETLANFIRRRITDGVFREVDPLLAARGFLGMLFQYAMAVQLFGAKFEPAASATFTEIWLKGMQR